MTRSDCRLMIHAVIFDIDGTLVDSVDLHAEAWREAFLKFGKDVPFGEIREQIGKGGDQLLPEFWSGDELEKIEKDLTAFRSQLYHERFFSEVRAFPKVRELFQRVRESGRRVALASSAKGNELSRYKKIAGISDLVEEETSSDDAEQSKPHPDIFRAALNRLGERAEHCLAVGDTPYDIIGAQRAGLKSLAVRCGGFPESSLQGAVAIYDDPADLLRRFAESPICRLS